MQPVSRLAPRKGLCFAFAAVCSLASCFLPQRTAAQQPTASSQPLSGLSLELQRSAAQQADLDTFLTDVQTPGSAQYHHWLTPEQFAQRFAPQAEAQDAATAWLQQQGFTVFSPSRTGMRIAFSGTIAQVQRSFSTVITTSLPAQGSAPILTSTALVLPVSHAFTVAAVRGLGVPSGTTDALVTLDAAIEANTQAAIAILSEVSTASLATEQEMLAEAGALGITVLQRGSGEVLDTATASATVLMEADGLAPATQAARPAWQSAPGLPVTTKRATPDASVADANALAVALNSFALQHGRVGALAPSLYRLSVGHHIYTHVDSTIAEGVWTAADGLGRIDTTALLKALATGTTGVNVKLDVSATTITHGQTLTLTYTVTGTGGTPSGTVTATLAGRSGSTTTLGPTTLNASGTATFATDVLAGDVYDLSGSYSGDSTFAAGTSNTVTTTVSPEAVALTAVAPTTKAGSTIPVAVTASASSGVGVPSGTVTVTAYGLGSASSPPTYSSTLASSTTSSTSAVVNVPASAVGKYTFQVNCTSSASFSCNQPQSFAVTVTQSSPTVTLTSTAEATVANSATQKYDLTVAVAAPSGSTTTTTPTGTVTIQDSGTTVATLTLSSGTATYVLSLSGGNHSLVAVYGGDTNYATASSTAVTITGTLITTTTALAVSPASISYGSAVALTATVTTASTSASGAATGTVTYTSSLQGVFATGTLSGGYVTVTSTALRTGTHTITATYSGDSNYATSTSSGVTVTVKAAQVTTTTVLTVSPTPPLAGQNTVLTATVTPSTTNNTGTGTTLVCTGQITLYSNGLPLGVGTLSNGAASVTAQLNSGNHSLTASYTGDTYCSSSTSTALIVSPALVSSAAALQSSVTYANAGQSIQLTATVAPGSTATLSVPSGTVNFYDLRAGVLTPVGSAALTATGTGGAVAALNVDGSYAGVHSFSAGYSGDSIFLASTSKTVAVSFGDFNLSVSPQSLTMARGGVATTSAAVSINNGFSGTVVLSCSPPASSLMTCSFSPSAVVNSGSSVLTVATTASTARLARPHVLGAPLREHATAGLAVLTITLLLPLRRRRVGGLLLLLCCAALASGGCGVGMVDSTNNTGGSSGTNGTDGSTLSGTPLGTQLLTLTASSSNGTLRHSYTFAVNVQ